jgi:hypothetical protein
VALLVYLVPAGVAALAALIGVVRRSADRPDPLALGVAGIAAVGFGFLAGSQLDPAVPPIEAIAGILVAALMLGAVPVYVFFLLGRALARHPITLFCPPGAYDCIS